MREVDLYIKISRECPRPGPGMYIAILEAKTAAGKTGTLTLKKKCAQITPHNLELTAVIDAIKRCKGDISLRIHSPHDWLGRVITNGWLHKWQQADWMDKGKPRPGSELYKELYTFEQACGIRFESFDRDLGSYSDWMDYEIKKEAEKDRIDI